MYEILFQFSITFTIKVLNRNKFDYLTKLEKEFCDIESELEINLSYFFKLHLIDSKIDSIYSSFALSYI